MKITKLDQVKNGIAAINVHAEIGTEFVLEKFIDTGEYSLIMRQDVGDIELLQGSLKSISDVVSVIINTRGLIHATQVQPYRPTQYSEVSYFYL